MCPQRSRSWSAGYASDNISRSSTTNHSYQGVCLVDLIFIYWYCKTQNKKKAQIRAQPGYVKLENQEFLDLTDRENAEFVYTL